MLMRRDWEGDEVCRDHVQVECCSSPGSELLSHAHEFAASSLFVVSYGHQLGTGQLVNAKPPKGHVVFSSVGEVLVLSSPTHKPYLFFWSNFSQVYLIRELITS
jgi:hypothetical protein